MPVFRTEKVRDYAVIAKHHLKNKSLSYKAKGLMTFMLCVPDDWDYSLAGLAVLASDGIDGVRSGIKELEKHGYLTRRRIRDAGGKLGDIEYTVHEIPKFNHDDEQQNSRGDLPLMPSTPKSEKPTLASPALEKPILGFPTLVKPTKVLPAQENPTQCNNKGLSINESNIKVLSNKNIPSCLPVNSDDSQQLTLNCTNAEPNKQAECLVVETAQGTGKPADHAMTLAPPGIFPVSVEQQFEQFWQLYPRKVCKKAAKKVWMGIKFDSSLFSIIMAAIGTANQYWKHQNTSLKHIPYPSTWLNEERWEDEFLPDELIGTNIAGRDRGGDLNAADGTNYTIGGIDDPYRAIIPD